jgi:hypothetical protein
MQTCVKHDPTRRSVALASRQVESLVAVVKESRQAASHSLAMCESKNGYPADARRAEAALEKAEKALRPPYTVPFGRVASLDPAGALKMQQKIQVSIRIVKGLRLRLIAAQQAHGPFQGQLMRR